VLPAERPASVVAATGPEGGFTPDEVAAARAAGFAVCGLGPRVLRAETAALAAVALLGYTLGDLA
jgi:16S rRNA (uracil1498-N3)-methyltransferase